MKVLALIPYWSEYSFPDKHIDNRDILQLGGRALINYTVDVASRVDDIDRVIIYSSDDEMFQLVDNKKQCEFMKRDKALDSPDASIEDVIESFLLDTDADVVVLMHPKNPFLKSRTIDICIEKVRSGKYDSAFVVSKARKLAWFDGKPLNYVLGKDTPTLASIEPLILESSSVYVFTREVFEKMHARIGENPFMMEIGHFEGFEVGREDDYEIAELIVNSGFEISSE